MSSLLNSYSTLDFKLELLSSQLYEPLLTMSVAAQPQKSPEKRQDTRVIKTGDFRDFPGDPVVKNPPSNAGDVGSIPSHEIKILHAVGQQSPSTAVKTQHSQIQSINHSINWKKKKPKQLGTPTILWWSNLGSATSYPITLYKLLSKPRFPLIC